jgi:hypothetical protein
VTGYRVSSLPEVWDGEPGTYWHDAQEAVLWAKLPSGVVTRLREVDLPVSEDDDGRVSVAGTIRVAGSSDGWQLVSGEWAAV